MGGRRQATQQSGCGGAHRRSAEGLRTNRAPIRHEGTTPNSSFLPSRSGYAVKDEAREQDGEPAMTLSNLNGEFARIVTTDEVVASFAAK
jgi:hypothetical protein